MSWDERYFFGNRIGRKEGIQKIFLLIGTETEHRSLFVQNGRVAGIHVY